MIIGLAGKAGCGKSTVANSFVKEHGFTVHKFAGPLKKMLHCLGLDERHTDGFLKTQSFGFLGGHTPRYAMQTLGTEWGRNTISETLWLDAWQRTMPEGDIIVDDVRFDNEFDLIKSLGGLVIEIQRIGTDKNDQHNSEKGLDRVPDCVILNDTDVNTLIEKVKNYVKV